jgi:lipoyl(octanoyl) transferase
MWIFATLDVYHDIDSRSAALNMAIDEALLESVTKPTLRFYRWDHPALSFGYFGKLADVLSHERERDIVRRWTGGGIVFHGEDLTYSLIIPENEAVLLESPRSIYQNTHAALRAALEKNGRSVELVEETAPKISDSCFANPVRADVMLDGQKIAGAAQRRTRRGLLQQGSVQNIDLPLGFEKCFAAHLSRNCNDTSLDESILHRADRIAVEKYATPAWLGRR